MLGFFASKIYQKSVSDLYSCLTFTQSSGLAFGLATAVGSGTGAAATGGAGASSAAAAGGGGGGGEGGGGMVATNTCAVCGITFR